MQVSSTIVIVIAELCVALLIGSIILFVYTRKLKALIKKQQSKLLSVVAELKDSARATQPSGIDPAEHERQLEACKKRAENAAAATLAERETLIQDLQQQLQLKDNSSEESETSVQILKEELLKAQEELIKVEAQLSEKEQALAEQIQSNEESLGSVEALDNLTQENQELAAKLALLESENSELKQAITAAPEARESIDVGDSDDQQLVIAELQEQLQRQIRSTQEAETCVQVLSKELLRGKEAIAREEKTLAAKELINEENQQLKSTLEALTQESQELKSTLENLAQEHQELAIKLALLESENSELQKNIGEAALASDTTADQESQQQQLQQQASLILELQQQVEQLTQATEAQLAEAQTRTQEIEVRAQLLNKELVNAQQDLAKQEQALAEQASITAENQQLKLALQDITQQREGLQDQLASLENEMSDLRQNSTREPLEPATTASLKEQEALVQQLQEQLEEQTRSTQESEACVQTLSRELLELKQALANQEKVLKGQEKALKEQEKVLKKQTLADTEAQRLENHDLKEALAKLTQESQELIAKVNLLEAENTALKQESSEASASPAASDTLKYKKLQAQYKDLQNEYAELEEKYTELTNL